MWLLNDYIYPLIFFLSQYVCVSWNHYIYLFYSLCVFQLKSLYMSFRNHYKYLFYLLYVFLKWLYLFISLYLDPYVIHTPPLKSIHLSLIHYYMSYRSLYLTLFDSSIFLSFTNSVSLLDNSICLILLTLSVSPFSFW